MIIAVGGLCRGYRWVPFTLLSSYSSFRSRRRLGRHLGHAAVALINLLLNHSSANPEALQPFQVFLVPNNAL